MCSAPTPPDLAQHFERIVTDRQLKAGRALAAAMGIQRGGSVLDLGCGTGLLSEHLADLVGLRGDVLGLDPSPYHMAIAHQRSRPNLRFQVGSPFTLGRFPAGCFDAVLANGLLHTWPDHDSTLCELLRVLKPGGRLGLVTSCKDHPHPVNVVQRAVLAREPYASYPRPPEMHEYPVNADELGDLLSDAGFVSSVIEQQPDVNVHATVNAAIEFVQASAWGHFLSHLPEAAAGEITDVRAQARRDIANGLERLRTAEGIRHKGVRLMAVATKATTPL